MSSQAMFQEKFPIEAGDFATAGEASASIKSTLKRLGVQPSLVRRIAIATYEVEMNVIIHSLGGALHFAVTPEYIDLQAIDRGPGIPDIDQAMREGYSTAPDSVRDLGFGAGMGLPNMRRNADQFQIESTMGEGTSIRMRFSME